MMLKPNRFATLALTASAVALAGLIANAGTQAPAARRPIAGPQPGGAAAPTWCKTMGCNDCHTPWKMGAEGSRDGHDAGPHRPPAGPGDAAAAGAADRSLDRHRCRPPTPRGPAPGA